MGPSLHLPLPRRAQHPRPGPLQLRPRRTGRHAGRPGQLDAEVTRALRATMRRTARSQPRGFTLFELVLVMLVLAVIMAMVAPKLAGTARGRRTGDAATQITALAYYARS